MPAKPTQMGKFLPSGDLPSGEKTDVYWWTCPNYIRLVKSVSEYQLVTNNGTEIDSSPTFLLVSLSKWGRTGFDRIVRGSDRVSWLVGRPR